MVQTCHSSSHCVNVAPTHSSDVFVKTKNGFSQFRVCEIGAESNGYFSFSKTSNATGVACEGGALSLKT